MTEEAVCKFVMDDGGDLLQPSEIALKKFKIHHGMKADHPLNHVKFFDRKGDKQEAYYLMQSKKESMMPKENQSWIVRCFVKSEDLHKFE